jgi:hypothetical protein
MSTRHISSVADDFSGVLAYLKTRGIVANSPEPPLLEKAKRIHRATFSLILWSFRLSRLPEHGRVFVDEIASDALQILPQVLTGYSKTSKLLTRGILENTLRHLYFSDHPIEFLRMNRDGKWYVQIEDLAAYVLHHPAFIETEPKFDAVNKIKSLYTELSAGVHGRSVRDLEMRKALSKIVYDDTVAERETLFVERCAEVVNFSLAVFHRVRFNKLQTEDRRIIFKTMTTRAKAALSDTN